MPDISWVLVRVSEAGNIGFIARLLDNFDQSDLRLVDSVSHLSFKARQYSSGSTAILEQASCYPSLEEALLEHDLVIATTARPRKRLPNLIPSSSLNSEISKLKPKKIAIIFGNEASGLTNSELLLANKLVYIPTSSKKSSLNISHAFGIVAYNIFLHQNQIIARGNKKSIPLAKVNELEQLKKDIFSFLKLIEFVKIPQQEALLKMLASTINRLSLNAEELKVLKAILGKTLTKLKRID